MQCLVCGVVEMAQQGQWRCLAAGLHVLCALHAVISPAPLPASTPHPASRLASTSTADGGCQVVEVWREELLDGVVEIDSSLKVGLALTVWHCTAVTGHSAVLH